MKFEVKTEPVCVVLVAVPSYFAIVIITLGTGVQAHDAWFPLTVIVTIQSIAMTFIYSKQ
jgi:ABC-type microcin C transport system permease subunit YejB